MIAHRTLPRVVERRKQNRVITVPNLTEPLNKSIRQALKNPVDIQLEMYSSANPEVLNPLDLKMMSRLDRLRKHNELRAITKQQKNGLDKTLESIESNQNALKQRKQEIEKEKQIQLAAKQLVQNAK